MNTRNILFSIGLFVLVLCVSGFFYIKHKTSSKDNGGVFCTQEAELCPDGSYVGRTGPNCEFAECPTVKKTETGIVSGRVFLSPTCPVERIPPDPQCAPKGFSTAVDVFRNREFFFQFHTDASGNFSISLPVGDYSIDPHVDAMYPRCSAIPVHITLETTTTISISCDTGIR